MKVKVVFRLLQETTPPLEIKWFKLYYFRLVFIWVDARYLGIELARKGAKSED